MKSRGDTDDYRGLFLADTPMMDMRAPTEFAHGAFPSAQNLPLMTDDERAQVGTCYKLEGQAAAMELGHALVSGGVRDARLQQWLAFARAHPNGYLYCFRGGLRSQTVQTWLAQQGVEYPLIKGGYKAMRRFLIDQLESSLADVELVLIAGKTGTGKTRAINALSNSIDLEGLACHRGSSFGQLLQPQPSQIDFENQISIALLKQVAAGNRRIFLEDEGRLIGRLSLPESLRTMMSEASMVVIEETLDSRIDVVFDDYVVDLGLRYTNAYGDDGPQMHCERLQGDLYRIRKRLGGVRQQALSDLIDDAFRVQPDQGSDAIHRQWIGQLLADYYDPMYEYQLQQRQGKLRSSGSRAAVITWAQQPG
ncbi:MAG: tRNA 2-selenouridine(34) synthase MnmH [Halioglobus sp.]